MVILWFVPSLKIANLCIIHIERVLPDHDFWLECVKKSVLNFSTSVFFLNCSADGTPDHVFPATRKVLHKLDLQAHQLHPTLKQPKSIAIVKALNRMEMR